MAANAVTIVHPNKPPGRFLFGISCPDQEDVEVAGRQSTLLVHAFFFDAFPSSINHSGGNSGRTYTSVRY